MKPHPVALTTALLCALALGCAAVAQPAAPAEPPGEALTVAGLLDHMEAARKELKTFKADVAKTRFVAALDETEEGAGRIEFKTPRLLRLSLTNARTKKETVIFVGKEYAWLYRVQDKQAERTKLADIGEADKKKSANPLEYGLARDIHGLLDAYGIKLLPAEKIGEAETTPMELTPKQGTYAEGKVIFWVSTANWLPVQVREYKSDDEIVETHTFTNTRTNISLSDKLFEFAPPKDVDVILHDAAQGN